MFYEVTSNAIGTTAEITAVMPIRQGTVDELRTLTYATRLRMLLYTFNEIRKSAYESREVQTFLGATEAIRTLYSVRWMLIESDSKLLLTVNFDSPWEPYIRRIVDIAGPILDVILCHCEGYERFSTDLGFKQFAKWVAKYQEECEFLYTATPDYTVDDFNFLRQHRISSDPLPAQASVPPDKLAEAAKQRHQAAEVEQGLSALAAFHRLERLFRGTGKGKHSAFLHRATKLAIGDGEFIKRASPQQTSHYQDAIEWFIGAEPRHSGPLPPAKPTENQSLEEIAEDLQGNVLNSYKGMTHGCIALLRITDRVEAAQWLQTLSLTREAESAPVGSQSTVNLAITYEGLRHCGLPEAESKRLPKEFREGMEARAGLLGDINYNHPDQWERPLQILGYQTNGDPMYGDPIRLSSVDILLTLQSTNSTSDSTDHLWSSKHPLYADLSNLLNTGENAVQLLAVQPLRRPAPDQGTPARGHFGFLDGISKTTPRISPAKESQSEIDLGDLLLGHVNRAKDPLEFQPGDVAYNGTFQALRKIEQDVTGFNRFLDEASAQVNLPRDTIASKMVGREKNGTLLHLPNQPLQDNEWDYSTDTDIKVPLHCHIRRSNPRGSSSVREKARIVRRGFMYGPTDNQPGERGLVFMALNASIAEQFEVIQRWCTGGNSTDALSHDADPLLGVARTDRPRHLHFKHDEAAHSIDMNANNNHARGFTVLKWGMYALVPSLSGIQALVSCMTQPPAQGTDIDALENRISRPDAPPLHLYGRALSGKLPDYIWKVALEDASAYGAGITSGLWSYVETEKVLRIPYGLLVADPQLVQGVLSDTGTNYSARVYWDRLVKAGVGEGYIGMDAAPTPQQNPSGEDEDLDIRYITGVHSGKYVTEATAFNAKLHGKDIEGAYKDALDEAANILQTDLASQASSGRLMLDLTLFVDRVLARLCSRWFGIPFDPEDTEVIRGFAALAGFVFNPVPSDYVTNEAIAIGPRLTIDAGQTLDRLKAGTDPVDPLLYSLYTPTMADSVFIRTLAGVAQGFVGPTRGTFLSMMVVLLSTEEFWRAQTALHGRIGAGVLPEYQDAKDMVRPSLVNAMHLRPVPEIVYRKAVRDLTLGNTEVRSGDLVILSLRHWGRTGQDALFGGTYGATSHACPGQPMAMGVLLGIVSALLQHHSGPGGSPLALELIQR